MPPTPPNLSRSNIIRTIPGWNQRTMARRDNHIRFISNRFPSTPSSDTSWVNPSLPPGASRLAIPKGSIRPGRTMFDVNVWELIFTDAPYPDVGNSGSGGLSIDPEQLRFAVGFPKNGIATNEDPAHVRTYQYNSSLATFEQYGQTIGYPDDGQLNYDQAGTAVALTNNGNFLLTGIPSSGTSDQGEVRTLLYDTAWSDESSITYNDIINSFYGRSIVLSRATHTARYSAEGAPGTNQVYVVERDTDGTFVAYIGDGTGNLSGDADTNFGWSIGISDLANNALWVVIGAPGKTNVDESFIRIVKGVDEGASWSWTKVIEIPVASGKLGNSVSMSFDSTVIAAGDPANGDVYVYYQSPQDDATWILLGSVISGGAGTRFGHSISMDRTASNSELDGITIAIGEPDYGTVIRPNSGRVSVMEYAGGEWRLVLNRIVGSAENEHLGETVALSNTEPKWVVAAGNRDSGRISVYAADSSL